MFHANFARIAICAISVATVIAGNPETIPNDFNQEQIQPDQRQEKQERYQPYHDQDDYVALVDNGLRDEFDWKLLKALSEYHRQSNIIISPISLKIILALLYEASEGNTRNEIKNVLQFDASKPKVRNKFTKLIKDLTNGKYIGCDNQKRNADADEENYIINLGTRIYLDSQFEPQQQFQAKSCDKYQTKVETLNFTNAGKAAQIINQYVNDVTLGKISKLVSPEEAEQALMMFVNAIYFRGYWTHQFNKTETHRGGFYLAPNQPVEVEYMANTEYYHYLESHELDAKMIRLPYKGHKFAMFIILPNAKAGLQTLIDRLKIEKIRELASMMEKRSVDVVLPKFKFTFNARLAQTLKDLGLVTLFQNTVSLPGISRGSARPLEVTDILQKAGIEVNEEGSTAFAASQVQIGNKFGDAQTAFNATHPFLFYIEDQQNHTILFMGKMVNPLEQPEIPLPIRMGEGNVNVKPQSAHPTTPHYAYPAVQSSYVPSNPPILPPRGGNVPEINKMEDHISTRFNYFDLELLKEVASNENVFISPISIKSTLAMILEGARAQSAHEIAKVLRLPQNYNRMHLQQLLFDISDNTGTTQLISANAQFISHNLQINPMYSRNIQQYYKASIIPLYFGNVDQSVNEINRWVFNATRGLIPAIVGRGSVGSNSKVIITNALYFKGIWKYAFDPTLTTPRCFYLANGQCQDAYMMQNTAEVNYKLIGELDAHALELPYSDDRYAMLILLPQVRNNILSLTKDLQHSNFNAIFDKLQRTEVLYEIPKFEIDSTVPLVSVLGQMGIREIFGSRANLSGIVLNEPTNINNIIHKTRIEVNEQGTIAAAATAAIVIPLMGSGSPRVIANHPFLFFIYRRDNRYIIFEGMMNKPLALTSSQSTVARSGFNTDGRNVNVGGPNLNYGPLY